MSGLLLAVGTAARPELLRESITSQGWTERYARCESAIIAASDDVETAFSPDQSVLLAVHGYTIPGTERLAALVSRIGLTRALTHLEAGGYAVLMVNTVDGTCVATGDQFASVPLYVALIEGGAIACSTPVVLGRLPVVDRRADHVAMAEWLRFGHTIGDRYLMRGIQLLSMGDALLWDGDTARVSTIDTSVRDARRDARRADAGQLTDMVEAACTRLSRLDSAPAHLQSAGFDSRFLLACWPGNYDPTCYTYGDPDAIEPSIAAQVAAVRGSRHVHQFATAAQVAASLDAMFDASGVMVFPDRYIIGRRMRADGHRSVLDGFLGDVLIGNGYERAADYLGRLSKVGRRLGIWTDGKASRIGLDRMAEWLYDYMTEPSFPEITAYLAEEFVADVRATRTEVLHDLRAELARWQHPSDSLEVTLHTFALNNRSAHSTLQQAVLSRESVRVLTPFCSDRPLAAHLMSLHPRTKLARRLYRAAYVQRKPRYAAVPWGHSLLPIARPLLQHQVSASVIGRGMQLPGVTGNARGRPRDPNGWAAWLRTGNALRESAAQDFERAGITRGSQYFQDLAEGRARGSGKLFHAASMARWIAMASHAPTDARTSHPGLTAPGVIDE